VTTLQRSHPPTPTVLPACLLFLAVFAWFATHAVPSLYFGDNGELLAAIHTRGIPHPTGFPLLLLLGAPAARAHTLAVNLVLSATGALAVVLLSLGARRLVGRPSFLPTALLLLGSCTLLLHSSMARVYSLQLATLAAVFLVTLLYQPTPRWGLAFGFAVGLSLSTHLLSLAGPLFAGVLLWEHRRDGARLFPWVLLGAILSVSLYLWLPLRAALHPDVSWGSPENLGNLWAYLTQRQYADKMGGRDLLGSFFFLKTLLRDAFREWNPIVYVLAVWGGFSLYRSHRRKAWAILAVLLFNAVLLFAYGNDEDLDILYRYFLPSIACLAVLASVAIVSLTRWCESRVPWPRVASIGLLVLLLAALLPFPASRWKDLSLASGCRSYLLGMIQPIPQAATVVLMGDNQVFPAAYGLHALGFRPDLHYIEWEGTLFPEARRRLSDPLLVTTPSQLEGEWYRAGGGALYLATPRLVQPPFKMGVFGLLYRLSDETSEASLPPAPTPNFLPPRFTQAERQDREAAETLAEFYLMTAAWRRERADIEGALRDLEAAVEATPDTIRTLINAAAQFGELGRDPRSEALLRRVLAMQPRHVEATLNMGIHYGKVGRYAECREYLTRALALRPNHPVALHYLRQLDAIGR
jgi:hypothetical protein